MGKVIEVQWIDFGGELQPAQRFRIHPHPMEDFAER